jgi:hypothetical protein
MTVDTQDIPCGYAGGIGPDSILSVLANVSRAAKGQPVWIDMESSLRTKVIASGTGTDTDTVIKDVFSIEKCMTCVIAGSEKFPQALPVSRVSLLSI